MEWRRSEALLGTMSILHEAWVFLILNNSGLLAIWKCHSHDCLTEAMNGICVHKGVIYHNIGEEW
jgi:hypothetical protein